MRRIGYAHINGVRGDGVNPWMLGISGTVSEDTVRLAMYRIKEEAGLDWLTMDNACPILFPEHLTRRMAGKVGTLLGWDAFARRPGGMISECLA
jgi:hypothetical protein